MPIKFIIFSEQKKDNVVVPYLETIIPDGKNEIRFGRVSTGNDIVLKDDHNLVSSKHAILSTESGKFYLTDLNSTNKSFINEQQIPPHQPIEVSCESKIKMANFLITFTSIDSDSPMLVESPVVQELKPHEVKDESHAESPEITPFNTENKEIPDSHLKARLNPGEIANELHAIYQQHSKNSPEERKNALLDYLKTTLLVRDKSEISTLLIELKNMFPDQAYSLKTLMRENETLKKKVGLWTAQTGLPDSAFNALSDLAHKLIEEGLIFQSESDIQKFCHSIKNTIESLLSSFSDLDKGRKRILEDFIDIWNQKEYESPLLSKTTKEMMNILLDWRDHNSDKSSPASILEKSLQILIIHEISLLKGYQEATYRGSLSLLEKLDPGVIAYHIGKRTINLGIFRIPYKFFPPLVRMLTWQELVKRHQQLRNEDASTFETIFRPSFAAKYKEVIDRSKQTSRNLSETRTFYRDNLKTIKREVNK